MPLEGKRALRDIMRGQMASVVGATTVTLKSLRRWTNGLSRDSSKHSATIIIKRAMDREPMECIIRQGQMKEVAEYRRAL
jgi:hypothetical protein